MLTIVGQCRGDLAMFRRQLFHAGLVSTVEGKPKFVKPGPGSLDRVVILGDLISPLNAWCAFAPTTPSEDAEIMKLAVLAAEKARLVAALAALAAENARLVAQCGHCECSECLDSTRSTPLSTRSTAREYSQYPSGMQVLK